MPGVSPQFARLLADQRESLNERFELRRRSGVRIDPAVFLAHLREQVGPLLEQVNARFPERAPAVLTALYDASLDLFAASLLGSDSKLPVMQKVWTDLLPQAIELLAREPTSLTGCLCNAVYQVAQQRGTNADLWLNRMRSALPRCTSLQEIVDAGLVVAWQAGMPQYRLAALETAARMKPELAARTLGMTEEKTLPSNLESLKRDRWFRIEKQTQSSTLIPVSIAGAFSGFGGLFAKPPRVSCVEDRLIVTVDDVHWQMIADAYGVWFRRCPPGKVKPAPLPRDVSVEADGTVRWGKRTCQAPHLAKPSSIACDGVTLAVTITTSHHLFLFAPVQS